MTVYTIRSWNNHNPQQFAEYDEAVSAAVDRAKEENALVKLLDNDLDEEMIVCPDGTFSKWHAVEEGN